MTAWDPAVTTVPVKRARDRFAAELRPLAPAREAIEHAVADAIGDASRPPVPGASTVPAPARDDLRTLAIRWQSASVPSVLAGIPGVKLRDSRTAQVTGSMPDLFRLLSVFLSVAATLTGQPPYC
jgi:D-amino peptidase